MTGAASVDALGTGDLTVVPALDATIETTGAGEAGKGFAVVAKPRRR
ncbi:methyl-accepting chemotaxis protein [Blastococcus sp. CT_GayMR20]|nr:methyl-accepting chemotaxis protein [Blastococcus sp. CT_GayMR20]